MADKKQEIHRFFGPDQPIGSDERDRRLTTSFVRVRDLMFDGEWRTLPEICEITHTHMPSASAYLRYLRRPEHGGHTVEKEYIGEGLWKYRVVRDGNAVPEDDEVAA